MPARCFLAFDLPHDAIGRLRDARAAFLDVAPDWAGEKWVAPELLHVTLKFIGALPDGAVSGVVTALAEACAALPGACLSLVSVRAVPSPRRANMLWATMRDADGSMARLAATVDDVLASRFGVPASERDFAPHVTLARARRPRRVSEAALQEATARLADVSASDGTMSVRSITLYASTLGPQGPSYEALGAIGVGEADVPASESGSG